MSDGPRAKPAEVAPRTFTVVDRRELPLAVWTAPAGPALFDWAGLEREAVEGNSGTRGFAMLLLAARDAGRHDAATPAENPPEA